jgi:glycerophosphoryl diester phosphodiesterase
MTASNKTSPPYYSIRQAGQLDRRMTGSNLATLRSSDGLIRIHGHRGAGGVMPENTRAGFSYAFSIDIDIIELDVLNTADGVAVITHNPYLPLPRRECQTASG